MRQTVVIDSSTIISLAKTGSLELLEKLNAKILCPFGVKKESLDEGLLRNFEDAVSIQKIFKKNIVKCAKSNRFQSIDESVVFLAEKRKAIAFLCNDVALARKAAAKNLSVKGSADFLFDCFNAGVIEKNGFVQKINKLVEQKRLSSKNADFYLKEVKN